MMRGRPFLKGYAPWNKGLKGWNQGHPYWGPETSHRKGLTYEEEYGEDRAEEIRGKLQKSHLGQHSSPQTEWKKADPRLKENTFALGHSSWKKGKHIVDAGTFKSGEEHPNWKGGVTPLTQQIHNRIECKDLVTRCFVRDNFRCSNCGSNRKLVAHHIISIVENLGRAFDLDNLITLCASCHTKIHWQERRKEVICI